MLPAAARLNRSADFRRVTRSGVRAGRATLVVHAAPAAGESVRVGFVVSKAVGGAVVRNRVKRQLRHLVAPRLAGTPDGTELVVRALPQAGRSPMAGDLDAAWSAALVKLSRRQGPVAAAPTASS